MTTNLCKRHKLEYAAHHLKRGMYEEEELSTQERVEVFLRLHQGWDLVDYHAITDQGLHLLHTVAAYDNIGAVDALINLGVDPHTTDIHGNTLLHHAFSLLGVMEYGDYDCAVIRWAANNGFDINIKNNNGQTPLFLLGEYLTHFNSEKDTPLAYGDAHTILQDRQDVERIIQTFEELGGDIYHQDHQGRTFLDCLPHVHPIWKDLDCVLDVYRIKIQRHTLINSIDDRERAFRHKKM